MICRNPLCFALAVFLAFTVQSRAEQFESRSDLLRLPSLRQEIPDGEYIPTVMEDRKTSPAYKFHTRGFFTTQVNVSGTGENIQGDAANEPSIAVDPNDPDKMAIGWRQFDTISSSFRQAGWGYSGNGGQDWTFPGKIEPGIFRSDPVLDSDSEGNFFYNSLTVSGEDFWCDVFKSTDGGATWDTGTFAQGGDKQWMVIDKTGGIGNGHHYAYWTVYWSICYPGFFTRSTDGGASYENCEKIPDDPFWGTLAVGPEGELYVCGFQYYDFVVAMSSDAKDSSQSVSWDYSTNVDLDGQIAYGGGPNPGGLLGQTWVAADQSSGETRGNVYLLCSVLRYSTPDSADVMFSRSTDQGATWSSPVRVNDDSGTDAHQWFGTMSVAPDGRIDVIWLDTRNDPGGYDSALYYSSSNDAGITWSENEKLTETFDPHIGWPQQNKMGDYFDMVSNGTGVHISYAATFNGEQDVYYGRISTDIHVPGDYGTIQEAVNAAVDGNIIIIEPGTYQEHDIDFLGKAITVMSNDPEDSVTVRATVVDGDSMGAVFLFQSGEDSTSILAGLTITGGSDWSRGAVSCENSSPEIYHNNITDNYSNGIRCNDSSSIITSNRITGNSGSGIACSKSSPLITGNVITGNSAPNGGGISCSDSSFQTDISISNNIISGNSAQSAGGGIYSIGSTTSIMNNVISGNTADEGGGIFFGYYSTSFLTNTILWDDDGGTGDEFFVGEYSSLTLSYSVVDGDSGGFYLDKTSYISAGEGLYSDDPMFRDPVAGDFHLNWIDCGDPQDSYCVDAGDPSISDTLMDCSRGLGMIRSDIGAYGGGDSTQVGIGEEEQPPDPRKFLTLAQNHPNPFNPSTTISFYLPESAGIRQPVYLAVYDIQGRRVKILIDSVLKEGSHSILWDGRNDRMSEVSSGIYFYSLTTGNETHTRKMVVLK